MPALQSLAREFSAFPLRIVSISVDENRIEAQKFLQRYGQGITALHDADGQVAEAYGLLGMPSSFLIDPQGRLTMRHEGFRKGDESVWRHEILRLLGAAERRAVSL